MKDRIFVHEGLKVLKSKTHGYGVYTMQPIRKGDIIEECVVPMDSISYSYLYLGTRSVQLNSETMQNYRFAGPMEDISKQSQFFVLPTGFAMIYNHSDEPNIEWYHDTDNRLIVFRALRDIETDEELCHYYNESVTNMSKQLEEKNEQDKTNHPDLGKGIFVGDNN